MATVSIQLDDPALVKTLRGTAYADVAFGNESSIDSEWLVLGGTFQVFCIRTPEEYSGLKIISGFAEFEGRHEDFGIERGSILRQIESNTYSPTDFIGGSPFLGGLGIHLAAATIVPTTEYPGVYTNNDGIIYEGWVPDGSVTTPIRELGGLTGYSKKRLLLSRDIYLPSPPLGWSPPGDLYTEVPESGFAAVGKFKIRFNYTIFYYATLCLDPVQTFVWEFAFIRYRGIRINISSDQPGGKYISHSTSSAKYKLMETTTICYEADELSEWTVEQVYYPGEYTNLVSQYRPDEEAVELLNPYNPFPARGETFYKIKTTVDLSSKQWYKIASDLKNGKRLTFYATLLTKVPVDFDERLSSITWEGEISFVGEANSKPYAFPHTLRFSPGIFSDETEFGNDWKLLRSENTNIFGDALNYDTPEFEVHIFLLFHVRPAYGSAFYPLPSCFLKRLCLYFGSEVPVYTKEHQTSSVIVDISVSARHLTSSSISGSETKVTQTSAHIALASSIDFSTDSYVWRKFFQRHTTSAYISKTVERYGIFEEGLLSFEEASSFIEKYLPDEIPIHIIPVHNLLSNLDAMEMHLPADSLFLPACQMSCTWTCQSFSTAISKLGDTIRAPGDSLRTKPSCTRGCQVNCEEFCEKGCEQKCQGLGACETNCEFRCETYCQGACEFVCQGACQGNCEDSCQQSCQDSCQASCESSCEDRCEGPCEYGCTGSCEGSCEDFCTVECQNNCQFNCQSPAESACQDRCEFCCELVCECGCEVGCEIGCEEGCEAAGCEVECEGGSCQNSCEKGDCETKCQIYCMSICERQSCELDCTSGSCQRGSCETSGCEYSCVGRACENEGCQTCESYCQLECTVGCQNLCQDGCQNACQDACAGMSCMTSCMSSCTTDCQNDCMTACMTLCMEDCATGSCQSPCQNGCTKNCAGYCASGCQSNCIGDCQYGTCQGSTCQNASCQASSCQGATCEGSCAFGCQGGCAGNCQGFCTFSCVGICQGGCHRGCQGGCQNVCASVCQEDCLVGGCQTTCASGKCQNACQVGDCQECCACLCQETCTSGCTSSCTADACQTKCQAACQAQGKCEVQCEAGCVSQAVSGCEFCCELCCEEKKEKPPCSGNSIWEAIDLNNWKLVSSDCSGECEDGDCLPMPPNGPPSSYSANVGDRISYPCTCKDQGDCKGSSIWVAVADNTWELVSHSCLGMCPEGSGPCKPKHPNGPPSSYGLSVGDTINYPCECEPKFNV